MVLWGKQWGSQMDDEADCVHVLSDNSVLVSGSFWGGVLGMTTINGGLDDFWIWLSSDGTVLNYGSYGSNAVDYVYGMTADNSTYQVFIAGTTDGTLPGQPSNVGGTAAYVLSKGFFICPLGFYCPLNDFTTLPCPNGTYCNVTGLSQPIYCPSGYYCPSVKQSAKPCPMGSFCPRNVTQYVSCPLGSYCPSPSQQLLCQTPGDLCNNTGLLQPYDCPVGYTCANTSVAVPCGKGDMCNSTRSVVAQDCPVGFMCPSPSVVLRCSLGTICNATRMTVSIDCPVGYYCPNVTSMVGCPLGSICISPRLMIAPPCPVGSYCATPTTPQFCINGTYCPSGSIAPTLCNMGEYCPAISRANCTTGYMCPSPAVQLPCSLHYYCASGVVAQTICPVGYYCFNPASIALCNVNCTCNAGSILDCMVNPSLPTSGSTGSAVSGADPNPSLTKGVFMILVIVGSLVVGGCILKLIWDWLRQKCGSSMLLKEETEMSKV